MTLLDKIQNIFKLPSYDYMPPHEYNPNATSEALCPCCNHWTSIETPAQDGPPTGTHKVISWCVWCGREFTYFY